MKPSRLTPDYREKLWGKIDLGPWFPDQGKRIGEVWFESEDPLPILVKFIFTSEKLSVQVHPDDDYAREHDNSPGKTEMWHILAAEPGARIALGFLEPATASQVRDAIASGEIERLLKWFPVHAGDTFFTPAGTVHAIGPGIVLCEIQENSDLTYRLYDYGRPRELHIDKSLAVANLGVHPGPVRPERRGRGHEGLAKCRYFETELLRWSSQFEYTPDPACFHLLVFTEGQGRITGERIRAGDVWLIPAGCAPFSIEPEDYVSVLRTFVPQSGRI